MNTLDLIATLECEACQFHAEKGTWPLQGGSNRQTHCSNNERMGLIGCHRSWTSMSQAHCTVCHGQFATNGVADYHWREPRGKEPHHVDWKSLKVLSGDHKGKPVLFEDESGVIHRANHASPKGVVFE